MPAAMAVGCRWWQRGRPATPTPSMHGSDGIGWPRAPVVHYCQQGQGGASMGGCRVCKIQGVLPFVLSFFLLLSMARAPAAQPASAPGPEGQTFSFPWPPDWVAQGKYQKMVLRGVIGSNPGQWDVHACGTLPDCLMPSGPQFNGLVYHN